MANPDIVIEETKPWHLRELADSMHGLTAELPIRLGLTPKKALWMSYRKSLGCKTAFINGKIAAVWGISGVLFGEIGRPWLIMAPAADEYPFKVAFIYRQELKKMQELFPVLEDFVEESNEQAIRLMKLMGFKLEEKPLLIDNKIKVLRARRTA